MAKKRLCAGGFTEGPCKNLPGPMSRFWCDSCELLRREHISEQLRALVATATKLPFGDMPEDREEYYNFRAEEMP